MRTDYKDAEKQFKKVKIQQSTDSMAVSDLEQYGKALEMAIMKYHSLKMDEINKIIRELWMKTYKGSDIDTIEIRSDSEGTRSNQNINYRVVMIKGDAVMDLRGRCSAGQKVLACIIIRLALAESFCLNCGILALDEPTTNLDAENIASLADSLVDIIETRRAQSNFQLIIITHDEEFLAKLGKKELADNYFRVSKELGNGSRIEKQAI